MNPSPLLPAPQLSVVDQGGSYNGNPYPATITISGINGTSLEGVPVTLDYQIVNAVGTITKDLGTQAPVLVGSYQVTASFPGSADYSAAKTNPYPFRITRATPDLIVTDGGGTYTGSAYPASVQVNGVSTTALEGKPVTLDYQLLNASGNPIADLGAQAPVQAGSYSVQAAFAGSADYYTATSNPVTFTISPAAPVLSVTDAGGPYTGSSYPASIQINGVSTTTLEGVPVTLDYQLLNAQGSPPSDLGTTAPVQAGTYRVTASFAGSVDYSAQTTTPVEFTISRVAPSVSVTDGGGGYTGDAYPGSVTINGVATDTLEGVGVSLAYYLGTDTVPLIAVPTDGGSYTVDAEFPGSTDYLPATASAAFQITPATPTLQLTDAGGVFNNSPYPATATMTGVVVGVDTIPSSSLGGVTPSLDYQLTDSSGDLIQDLGANAPSLAGNYTVTATYAGSQNYSSVTKTTSFLITPAMPTLAVSDSGGVYTGLPAAAQVTLNGSLDTSLEGVAVTLDYQALTAAGNLSADLGAQAPEQVGTYRVTASFAGSADYSATTSNSVTFTISPAAPVLSVMDLGGVYTGSSYPASIEINGVSTDTLEDVPVTLDYQLLNAQGNPTSDLGAQAPVQAGSYKVTASFAGSMDYSATTSIPIIFTISPVSPALSVSDAGGPYTGTSYPASVQINGVSTTMLEGVSVTFDYRLLSSGGFSPYDLGGQAPVQSGSYSVTASFPGSVDYTARITTIDFTITQVTPTLTVSDAGGPYTGAAYPASVQINGVSTNTLENMAVTLSYQLLNAEGNPTGLASSQAPVQAGTYSVTASFPGSVDYSATTSTTVDFTITPITPTLTVSDVGGPYTGSAYPASIVINGVSTNTLENTLVTLSYQLLNTDGTPIGLPSSQAPVQAGTYSVTASFPGSVDYSATTSTTVDFTITPVAPTLTVSDAGGPYTGSSYTASFQINGVSTTTLENVAVTLSYQLLNAEGNPTGLPSSQAPMQAGTYSVTASFPGSIDYSSQTAAVDFTITPVAPTLTVSDAGGPYTGSSYPASVQINDVSTTTLENTVVTLSYQLLNAEGNPTGLPSSQAPVQAGTYSVTASFPGSVDYSSQTAAVDFTITPVAPTLTVSDAGGVFNNSPYPATATITGVVAGVDAMPSASLGGVSPTFDYHLTDSEGNFIQDLGSRAPSIAGSYAVTATYAGSQNYKSVTTTVDFNISRAETAINLVPVGGIYSGLPFAASVSFYSFSGSGLEGVPIVLDYQQTDGEGIVLADLGNQAPTEAGYYTVSASFAGSTDYLPSNAGPDDFQIGQAFAQIMVKDPGGTFNGSPFPATAVVTPLAVVVKPSSGDFRTSPLQPGVGSIANSGLVVTFDYQQINADGSSVDLGNAAPVHAGSYEVIGSFAGNTDYLSATSTPVPFVIDKAVPTVAVTVLQPTAKSAPVQVRVTVHGVVPGVDTTPATKLEGVSPVLTFYANATAGALPLTGAPSQVGNYKVFIDYPGSQDYQQLTSEDFFRINPIVASGSVQNPTTTTAPNNLIIESLLSIPINGQIISNLLVSAATTTQVQQAVQAIVLVVISLPVNIDEVGNSNEFTGINPDGLVVVNEEGPEIGAQLASSAANGLIVPPLLTGQFLPGPGADEREPSRDAGDALGFLQRSMPRFNRKALQVTDSVFDGDDTVTLIEVLTRGETPEPLTAVPEQPAPGADASKTEPEVVGSEEVAAPANGNRTLVVTLIVVVSAGLMLGAIVKLRMRWLRIR